MTDTRYNVEVRLKDSSTAHHYGPVDSVHEEGSYTVLFTHDVTYRFPTAQIFRLRITRYEDIPPHDWKSSIGS